MREFLFRGQIIGTKDWVIGSLIYSPSENQYYIVEHCDEELSFPVIPETVGQFTGLCDKNGKRIFEGDIVKWVDNQTKGRCVQGVVTMFGFSWCVKNVFNGDYENWCWSNNTHEIIGNIHAEEY